MELAELASLFSSFGSCFKYDSTTKLFVKPALFFSWLQISLHRGLNTLRLAMHGSDTNSYDLVEADPLGFSLRNSGRHGRSYGDGLYLGLSDQVPASYNTEGQQGTCIVALVMTSDKLDQQQSYNGQYKTFRLGTSVGPPCSMNNCIVCHEMMIALVLGKAVAV